MTGISWHLDTVVVVRAATITDRYGDTIPDWAGATETTVPGCRVVPAGGTENIVDRQQLTRRWVLYAPLDADITAADRIRWDGADYDIDGEIRQWRSATGALGHIEADLVRMEG